MNFKLLFSQFRPWMGLKILCFTASNRLFNPHANIFYGISAEDQVVQTLLGKPKAGYYVDVGCNHPIKFSNTFVLYMRGWKGLTVDANSDLIALHKKVRPKDISVCCAVSDSEKTIVFTKFLDVSVSSISEEFIKEVKKTVPVIAEEEMKTRTLNSILIQNNAPNEFDLLSIDVEGHDFKVLKGINLAEFRPKLIMIEMKNFNFENLHSNEICSLLENNDYKLATYYNNNGFFLRKDLISSE